MSEIPIRIGALGADIDTNIIIKGINTAVVIIPVEVTNNSIIHVVVTNHPILLAVATKNEIIIIVIINNKTVYTMLKTQHTLSI